MGDAAARLQGQQQPGPPRIHTPEETSGVQRHLTQVPNIESMAALGLSLVSQITGALARHASGGERLDDFECCSLFPWRCQIPPKHYRGSPRALEHHRLYSPYESIDYCTLPGSKDSKTPSVSWSLGISVGLQECWKGSARTDHLDMGSC